MASINSGRVSPSSGRKNTSTSNGKAGAKKRSDTITSHTGSRVEPSHVTDKARDTRAKSTAKKVAKKAASKASK